MDITTLLARADPAPTRCTLIGVGQFGRTLLMQSRRIPLLDLRILCDRDVGRLDAIVRSAGLTEDRFRFTSDRRSALNALEHGKVVLTDDPDLAIGLPSDVVVEATGNAEAGAANATRAIARGRHVCLVTKETDCLVGPLLSRRARSAGVVLSQVDGDQPSLLLALLSWAGALGLDVAGAGKASEHDFVWCAETGQVRAAGLPMTAPFDAALWGTGSDDPAALVAARAKALSAIPQRTPPDFCELCLVSNASGLLPDRPDLHAAIARPLELADLFRGTSHGGLFSGDRRLDIFNCLRREDEISAAGGVYAVIAAPDPETGALFRDKGIPVSRDGRHVLIYNPTHLLGVEAPMSVLVPHRLGLSTGAQAVRPVSDVTMRASRDLRAGETLTDLGHHHRVDGIAPLLTPHAPLGGPAPVPYFLALGARVARDVASGAILACDDVVLPGGLLAELRREQDRVTSWD